MSIAKRFLVVFMAAAMMAQLVGASPAGAQTAFELGSAARDVAPRGEGFGHRLAAYAELRGLDYANKKVDDGLQHLAEALSLVSGDGVLDKDAFKFDEKGAKKLEDSNADPAKLRVIIPELAAASRSAAVLQIQSAADRLNQAIEAGTISDKDRKKVEKNIRKAEDDLKKGDDEVDEYEDDDDFKDFHKAIHDYGKAWEDASKALKDLWEQSDSDSDLLSADIEAQLGLNPDSADTDGDRLTDTEELWTTFTDPANPMTDGLTRDDVADPDGDGLGNFDELASFSDPLMADTDGDTLNDGSEVAAGTDPSRPDTDDDGLRDDSELRLGTDPLNPDTNGNGVLDGDETYTSDIEFPDTGVSVAITGVGDVAVDVTQENESEMRWLTDLPGLASEVVDLAAASEFDSAEIEIPFDSAAVPNGDFEGLGVQYYDEELAIWVQLDPATTTVDTATGMITANTTHFTLFAVFYIPNWAAVIDAFNPNPNPGGGDTPEFVDVALVLDSSGSMRQNDPANLRREASKRFIDGLIAGDEVAVVDFDSNAVLLQGLTGNFEAAKDAVDLVDSSGGTNIGAGVQIAHNEILNNGDPTHARAEIVLTDGVGAYNNALTQQAIDNDIRIFTVGLGTGVNATLLTQIAEATGGQYFPVLNADDLPDVFSRIPVNLDPAGDEDNDGIPNGTEIDGVVVGTGATYRLDPFNPDSDGDGLMDGEEVQLGAFSITYSFISDPTRIDTDDDGLTDREERDMGLNRRDADWDNDGLEDGVEIFSGFNPKEANEDNDSYGDQAELERGSDPNTYDLDGADQGRAFIAGALLGEFGSNIPAFDTSLKDLAGDLVGIGPNIPYVTDGLSNIASGLSSGLVGLGCGVNDLIGRINPIGGGPSDAACAILNFRIKFHPEYFNSIAYLGGWIAVSLIPFLDIVASVRDVIGALVNGRWVGAGLEFIFGVIGFFAPVIGDVPGIAGKILKFLAKAPELVGAVLGFIVRRFGDDLIRPLVRAIWNITDGQLARAGGVSGVTELGEKFVNTKKLVEWLAANVGNKITKAQVSRDNVLDSVRRNWNDAPSSNTQGIRNLAAEAVSTEAVVDVLASRGYDVVYVSRNVPLDVGDDVLKSIPNGPDIVATRNGETIVVEVKGSNQADFSISASTITNGAGVQTSRAWLSKGDGARYMDTLRKAAVFDESLVPVVNALDNILAGGPYNVIIAGAAENVRFSGTLENVLPNLGNNGSVEVLEIDVPRSLLDDAIDALTPG